MRFGTRIRSLALVAFTAVALAACGGADKTAHESAPAPVASPPAAPQPAPVEPAAAETKPPSAEAPAYANFTGDAEKGARIFSQCKSCHSVAEGKNNVGPSLYQIVGRESGTVAGFKYSDANANSDAVWTEETLFAYLERPQAFMPGTIMTFPGLRSPQDRADVIAYLKSPS